MLRLLLSSTHQTAHSSDRKPLLPPSFRVLFMSTDPYVLYILWFFIQTLFLCRCCVVLLSKSSSKYRPPDSSLIEYSLYHIKIEIKFFCMSPLLPHPSHSFTSMLIIFLNISMYHMTIFLFLVICFNNFTRHTMSITSEINIYVSQ